MTSALVVTDPRIAPPEDEALIAPEAHLIAKSILDVRRRKLQNAPTQEDLAAAMTNIQINGQKPASNIIVTLLDPEFEIFDSGIFDADENSEIDPIDLNYPDGSRYWWRLTILSPKADHTIQLTWMTREAVYLMHLLGPLRANRASTTRAEFFKLATSKVKEGNGIHFYSHELHVKEPIAASTDSVAAGAGQATLPASKQPAHAAGKTGGIGANTAGLMSKGSPLNATQQGYANLIVQIGQQMNAPTEAIVACVYAAMGESDLGLALGGGGLLQTSGVPGAYNGGTDAAGQIRGFYSGGTSFASPGAIAAARRGDPAWQIANETEVNAVWIASHGDSYAQQSPPARVSDAQAIVAAGGGGSTGLAVPGGGSRSTVVSVQAYYFEINPNELYYDGLVRLAQEVQWDFFLDGDRCYYDSQTDLIKTRPSAVIHRDDDAVHDWSFDWDARQIVTQMTLLLVCGPMEFAVDDVLLLKGFGSASTGSTVKPRLPGRWLIDSFQRNKGDVFTTFTLVQPALPKAEPAPQISQSSPGAGNTTGLAGVGVGQSGNAQVNAFLQKAVEIGNRNLPYTWGGGHGQLDVGSPGFDCSGYISACAGAAGWLNSPLVSGDFESWGQAGSGQEITIWCNSGHVYAEVNVPGTSIKRVDTVWDGGGPQGPHPRTVWPPPEGTSGFTPRHWPGT